MATAPNPTVPRKLRRGDTIPVAAPARSRLLKAEHDRSSVIDARFAAPGLRLTFADYADEQSSAESAYRRSNPGIGLDGYLIVGVADVDGLELAALQELQESTALG